MNWGYLRIITKPYQDQKIKNLERHLKRQPNSFFVYNYSDIGLKVWQKNMYIQPVLKEYKAVLYMGQYFSKTEDQCSHSMKQAEKETYENKIHHHDIMKKNDKAYLNSRECSVQEAVYHILPELKLRRIFPTVYFVNRHLPEERVQVLLSEKKNSVNYQMIAQIFSKNQTLIIM